MARIYLQNVEKKTPFCCFKMKPLKAEEVGKLRETWRKTIKREMTEVGKAWSELK